MSIETTTCVLIHGYRWGTPDWEHVMWGDPARREFGRIVKGIEVARTRNAHVYWGGGLDAENIHAFALDRLDALTQLFGSDVKNILTDQSTIGRNGGKTITEVGEALILCQTRQFSKLVLISDEVHLERCCLLALRTQKVLELRGQIDIIPHASDTTFTDQVPVLFEPRTAYRDNLHDVASALLLLDGTCNGDIEEARRELHACISTLREG